MRSFRLLAVALLAIVVLCSMSSVAHAQGFPLSLSRFEICVIQLGVGEADGTILWLPGFGWSGLPPSLCQDWTDVLGEDMLGRTILLHQFNLTIGAFTIFG
jgi:hypothetical protein